MAVRDSWFEAVEEENKTLDQAIRGSIGMNPSKTRSGLWAKLVMDSLVLGKGAKGKKGVWKEIQKKPWTETAKEKDDAKGKTKGKKKGEHEGDWTCSCGFLVFGRSRALFCARCGKPKPA